MFSVKLSTDLFYLNYEYVSIKNNNIMLSKYRFIHSIQIKQYVIGHNNLTEVRYEDTLIDPISF